MPIPQFEGARGDVKQLLSASSPILSPVLAERRHNSIVLPLREEAVRSPTTGHECVTNSANGREHANTGIGQVAIRQLARRTTDKDLQLRYAGIARHYQTATGAERHEAERKGAEQRARETD